MFSVSDEVEDRRVQTFIAKHGLVPFGSDKLKYIHPQGNICA